MPRRLNQRQVGNLIKSVANPSLDMKTREKNMTELETWAQGELARGEHNFDAALKTFNEQFSALEESFAVLDDGLDRVLGPVDDEQVDAVMAEIGAQISSENRAKSQDAGLMQRLRSLKDSMQSSAPSIALTDEAYKRQLDFTGLEAATPRTPPKKGPPEEIEMQRLDKPETIADAADVDVLSETQLDEILATPKVMPAASDGRETIVTDTADIAPPSQPVAPHQSEQQHPMAMSSLPDTLELSPPPQEATSLHDAVIPKPEPARPADTLSVQEQIDQITQSLSPQEQTVLKSMSSGKNENYTLELATLIQQREHISTKAKEADQKAGKNETLQDEDIAAQLQAEELDSVLPPKNP